MRAGSNRVHITDRIDLTGFLGRQSGTSLMRWKETCIMHEKTAFIADCLRGELPVAALCERYGISRDSGYRLLRSYRKSVLAGWRHVRERCTAWAADGHGSCRGDHAAVPGAAILGSYGLRAVLQR
jgi:hypothetical protein